MRVWLDHEIEDVTAYRLAEFERRASRKVLPPVPVDMLAEVLFDLRLLYDLIDEPPGVVVLGGLAVAEKIIIVNEKHLAEFMTEPGRDRFTIAHEMGHWDLFEQQRVVAPRCGFPDRGNGYDARLECRSAGGRDVKVVERVWWRPSDVDEESAVDRYASALLMPKHLLLPALGGVATGDWRNFYLIPERFGVTAIALAARLQRLKLLPAVKEEILLQCG